MGLKKVLYISKPKTRWIFQEEFSFSIHLLKTNLKTKTNFHHFFERSKQMQPNKENGESNSATSTVHHISRSYKQAEQMSEKSVDLQHENRQCSVYIHMNICQTASVKNFNLHFGGRQNLHVSFLRVYMLDSLS